MRPFIAALFISVATAQQINVWYAREGHQEKPSKRHVLWGCQDLKQNEVCERPTALWGNEKTGHATSVNVPPLVLVDWPGGTGIGEAAFHYGHIKKNGQLTGCRSVSDFGQVVKSRPFTIVVPWADKDKAKLGPHELKRVAACGAEKVAKRTLPPSEADSSQQKTKPMIFKRRLPDTFRFEDKTYRFPDLSKVKLENGPKDATAKDKWNFMVLDFVMPPASMSDREFLSNYLIGKPSGDPEKIGLGSSKSISREALEKGKW